MMRGAARGVMAETGRMLAIFLEIWPSSSFWGHCISRTWTVTSILGLAPSAILLSPAGAGKGRAGAGPSSCFAQLQRRNCEQQRPFQELIASRTALLQHNCTLKTDIQRGRNELNIGGLTLKQEDIQRGRNELNIQTAELSELRESLSANGGGPGRCTKCAAMQDELLPLLRGKAADTQQMLSLGQTVKDMQEAADTQQMLSLGQTVKDMQAAADKTRVELHAAHLYAAADKTRVELHAAHRSITERN
ncbi:hypothetical protein T484DRAFT_1911667 [Baffinella frigidus]|nr:hypothetical protein T484DRAFT_1911667 [Cryptophyta sp. CCMP2293]